MSIPKFRAWDKTRGGMYEVTALRWSVATPMVIDQMEVYADGHIRTVYGAETIQTNYALMQAIGHKNKHGEDIYESDILRGSEGDLCGVFWEKQIERDRYWATAYGFSIIFEKSDATISDIETVGNRYATPDLWQAIPRWYRGEE